MSRSWTKSLCPAVVALVAALSLSGCLEKENDGSDDSASPRVVQPGGPGDDAATVDPGQVVKESDVAHDDVAFMQMMVPHHAQALTMSKLARTRAESPAVKSIARRILAAQRPEILTMAAWLENRGVAVPSAKDEPADFDHGEHGHDTMHGMLTDAQLKALEDAGGADFDRLYLEGMIQHHEGAITMADAVATGGTDVQVTEFANEIVIGQGAEIDRMKALLADL